MNERRKLLGLIQKEDIPNSAVLITDNNKDTVSGNVIYFPANIYVSSSPTLFTFYKYDEEFLIKEIDDYNKYREGSAQYSSNWSGGNYYNIKIQSSAKNNPNKNVLPYIRCSYQGGSSESITIFLNRSLSIGATGSGAWNKSWNGYFDEYESDTIVYHRIVLNSAIQLENYDQNYPIYLDNE